MQACAILSRSSALAIPAAPAGDPKPKPPPATHPEHCAALASWYSEHGTGACGVGDVQSGYRFASLFLAAGRRSGSRHGRNTVTATMSVHGPYIGGRTFDLNAALKAALGCSDLCTVRWGYVR